MGDTTSQDEPPDPERLRGGTAAAGPQLVVRRASLDEYSTIRHVQATAIRSLGDKLLDPADVHAATTAVYSAEYLAELVRKTVFVAVLNGDIVGTCAWSASDDRGSSARIGALFIKPLFQGAGVGRHLVASTERDASLKGYVRFTATVPVAIVPLFAHLGYVIASFGTSRDVIPETAVQVAFLRKPG